MVIFNSYVQLPEGKYSKLFKVDVVCPIITRYHKDFVHILQEKGISTTEAIWTWDNEFLHVHEDLIHPHWWIQWRFHLNSLKDSYVYGNIIQRVLLECFSQDKKGAPAAECPGSQIENGFLSLLKPAEFLAGILHFLKICAWENNNT